MAHPGKKVWFELDKNLIYHVDHVEVIVDEMNVSIMKEHFRLHQIMVATYAQSFELLLLFALNANSKYLRFKRV